MKNFLRPLVLSIVYCLTSPVCFSQYTLTVTNGYGSGTYNVGDTVNIYSAAIPLSSSFDKWTGNISALVSDDEWHTTLIMPAQNISVAATFKTIGNITINHESIRGRDTLKEVYSYFPQNFKGVIFCFHGTGGAASNWINLWDYRAFLNDAIADTFAFIITEAEEVTKQADADGDGKLRWAYIPYDTVTNVDLANIRILKDTFRLRGITTTATKFYAVGMSNGGAFSPVIATIYNWRAAVSYCASQSQVLMNITNTPMQWCMAKYDNHPQVGPQGNADALADNQTLLSRGICSKYFLQDHTPVYAERFMRSGTITQTKANNLFAEFQSHNFLDANNYLLYATDTITARIIAAPLTFPTFLSLTQAEKIFVGTQVDAMYAAHQFFSDYNKKTLRFFDSLCDTVAIPTGIADFGMRNAEFGVQPNPTTGDLNVAVSDEMLGEEISVYDLSGRKVISAAVTAVNCKLQTVNLANGIYFVKIGTLAKKFVKQ
jgi:hypothetical protein